MGTYHSYVYDLLQLQLVSRFYEYLFMLAVFVFPLLHIT
jgi:hypothetical protein